MDEGGSVRRGVGGGLTCRPLLPPAPLHEAAPQCRWLRSTMLLAEVHNAVGGTFTACGPLLTRKRLVLTCDPCNVEYILETRFSNFSKGPDFEDIFWELMGDDIFNIDADEWQAQWRTANAHKKSRELTFINLVPILHRSAEEGAVVDLQYLMMRYMVDATCAALFNEAIGCLVPELPLVRFAQAADEVMEAVVVRHVLPHMWWKLMRRLVLGMESRLAQGVHTMDEFVARQVMSARGRGSGCGDLLLIFAKGDVFGTGDTTGAALTWFFWLVSRHHEVEAKFLDELKEKDHKGVREKDVLQDNTTVEPGTIIWIWGEDCRFKPERWLGEDGKLRSESGFKFLPFNGGPRTCLEKEVTFVQMKYLERPHFHISFLPKPKISKPII
ncbi:hypothetical protein AMTRI_Chr04g185050 [Amborella trichopoda]